MPMDDSNIRMNAREKMASLKVHALVVTKTPLGGFCPGARSAAAPPSGTWPRSAGFSFTAKITSAAPTAASPRKIHHPLRQFPFEPAITRFRMGGKINPPIPPPLYMSDNASARFANEPLCDSLLLGDGSARARSEADGDSEA